jgi:hypothetical protein
MQLIALTRVSLRNVGISGGVGGAETLAFAA